jgi:hypothetical protein
MEQIEKVKCRLFSHREIDELTGCWNSTYAKRRDGYAQIGFLGKMYPVHRLAYLLFTGSIPEGLFVCHNCDNRRCFNPKHLWLGTCKDDMEDKVKKGRQAKWQTHGVWNGSLSEAQVHRIFQLRTEGFSQAEIGKTIGIGQPHVSDILAGKAWKGVKSCP